MADENKPNELSSHKRGPSEVENWIFSLIPIAVAFTFYIVFITSSDIENKSVFIAYGAAAGFIGLESYWIIRGWRNKHHSIVLMGIFGIAATIGLLGLYLSFS